MPIEIVIRYAPGDDHEEDALAFARRLFAVLDEKIDSLVLVPGGDGLVVSLNGSVVYGSHDASGPPRLADVLVHVPASEA